MRELFVWWMELPLLVKLVVVFFLAIFGIPALMFLLTTPIIILPTGLIVVFCLTIRRYLRRRSRT